MFQGISNKTAFLGTNCHWTGKAEHCNHWTTISQQHTGVKRVCILKKASWKDRDLSEGPSCACV